MTPRVYIVSPTESYLTKRGKRHPKLADYLVAEGYDLEYISTTINHAEKVLFTHTEIEEAKRRVPYELTLFNAGLYTKNHCYQRLRFHHRLAWKVFGYLRRKVRDGDVVIIPSRPPELIWCISRLKMLKRIKTVLDLEDLWGSFLPGYSGPVYTVFGRYCDLLQNRAIPNYDRFVHVSELNLAFVRRYAPGATSEFLPLGFDPGRWDRCQPKVASGSGRRIRIYYCGSLAREVNVCPVVEAVSRMPDKYEMILIGCTESDEYYDDVHGFVKREKPSNITLRGILPPDEAAELISQQDVAAIPTRSAALPNKFFDAIGSYAPMLVCGEYDSADLVRKHGIGWVASHDTDAVTKILRGLDFDSIVVKSQNIARCRERFSHSTINARYTRLVQGLINQC
jgi:glycosyltransferase involved in cell wall biosynthesis